MFRYLLKELAKDKITGFTGIISSRSENISGINSYGLTAKILHNEQPIAEQWFTEDRIEVISSPNKDNKVVGFVKNG